ncbi:DUF4912 domain-containing protein [Alkalicoccobacillus murimartini]|uniref:Uncharacterized protein n=1 Tax=Alkalicoccobacillus murimartini TaxID=171685 RepID=A0ABT9YEF5_9BACI|nr:DUF4912 domain-containing protein [Alkalicoccobacillus murimartini]MDQ0205587.1 hypothetical protein [Alkalicoccobacillus murimartini]
MADQLKRKFVLSLYSAANASRLARPFLIKRALHDNQIEAKRLISWTPMNKWVETDQVFLLVQGPYNLTMNFTIQKETRDMVTLHFGKRWDQLSKKIRLHDVTDMIYKGTYSHKFLEVTLPEMTNNWHFHGLECNRSYLAEFGVGAEESQFIPLFRTDPVQTPNSKIHQTARSENELDWKEISDVEENWHRHFSAYTFYE